MYEKKIEKMWEKWYQQEMKSRKRFYDSVFAMMDESRKVFDDKLIAMTEECKQYKQKEHEREIDAFTEDCKRKLKEHEREIDAYESELKLVDGKNEDLREEVKKLRAEREIGNMAIPRPLTAYDDHREFWYINHFISQYEEGLRGKYGVQK